MTYNVFGGTLNLAQLNSAVMRPTSATFWEPRGIVMLLGDYFGVLLLCRHCSIARILAFYMSVSVCLGCSVTMTMFQRPYSLRWSTAALASLRNRSLHPSVCYCTTLYTIILSYCTTVYSTICLFAV